MSNGARPVSPIDGRNGRETELSQDVPLRERSRAENAARICTKCGETLEAKYVRALKGTFHLECFMCRVSILHRLLGAEFPTNGGR